MDNRSPRAARCSPLTPAPRPRVQMSALPPQRIFQNVPARTPPAPVSLSPRVSPRTISPRSYAVSTPLPAPGSSPAGPNAGGSQR
jgi:hypothetical protein